MIRQGSGVILFFGGYGDPLPGYYLGGFQVALNAIESLRRQLASELGAHGIRAVTLQTGGVPETIPESFDGREVITEMIDQEAGICLRIFQTASEGKFSEVRSLWLPQPDPSLTLTRTQCPAIVGNTGNKKLLTYAGFASQCNAQQPLTAHS